MMFYDVIKALHIVAMVAWFAGLFYLPRLYVYYVDAPATTRKTLAVMMYKLRVYIMAPAMVLTWTLGIALVALNPGWLQMGWLHAKITLVVLLSAYHGSLAVMGKGLLDGSCTRSAKFFKWYNELPTVLLVMIVLLVVLKPF